MPKFLRLLTPLLAALMLAACGATSAPVKVAPVGHPCNPTDYAMPCALTAPPPGLVGAVPSVQGIDFGWSAVSAAAARAGGFRFGASYLSADASKNWTRTLVAAYHAAGLATVNVWETSATRALSGLAGGRADAARALGQSLSLGSGYRPIYFAIDFDETASQAAAVAEYFRGIHQVLDNAGPVNFPRPVPVGAYGGYWAITRLFDAHLISYGWQTYAWSGGRWDPRAQIQQYLNGATFDHDRAVRADYGQTPYAPPKPKPRPKPKPKPPSPFKVAFNLGFQRGFTVGWDRRRHRQLPPFTMKVSVAQRGAFNGGFQAGFRSGWLAH